MHTSRVERWGRLFVALFTFMAIMVLVPAPQAEAQDLGPNDCTYWVNDGPTSVRYRHTGAAEHQVLVDGELFAKRRWGAEGEFLQFQLRNPSRLLTYELVTLDDAGNQLERKLCTERPNPGRVSGVQCNYRITDGVARITFVHTGEAIHKLIIGRVNAQTYLSGEAGDEISYVTDQYSHAMRLVVSSGPGEFVEKSRCTNSLLDPPEWPETPGSIVRCSVQFDADARTGELTFENGGAARYVIFVDGVRRALVKDPAGLTETVDFADVGRFSNYVVLAKTRAGELIARAGCRTTVI